VPAEIEAAVKDGLVAAFNDDDADDLEMHHIVSALEESVPMSRSHAGAINKILEWARDNATPVNYEEVPAPVTVGSGAGGEVVRRPRVAPRNPRV
jgi:hypothetical protein